MGISPIQYLVKKGFKITSDPNKYSSGIWGKRDYTVNGYNYDSYCGGYHRAYDFAKYHLAPIPAVADGIVTSGTSAYGNFGGTVVVASKDLGIQVIYGHLSRNIPVKIGQRVKQGQTIGYQSSTNYNNVYMASHLHIQFQNYGYLASENAFVCSGINPLKIDVSGKGGNISEDVGGTVLTYDSAWDWSGKVKTTASINYRIYPHTDAKRESVIKSGTTLSFDRIYYSDGYWWIRTRYKGGIWFVAVGKKESGVTFIKALDGGKLWVRPIGKVNTSGGKVKGKKNTHTIEDSYEASTPPPKYTPKVFNKNVNKGRSTSPYARGRVDMDYVHIRNRTGSQSRGFNWNKDTGDRLHRNSGDVYIYEVHNGWGRIYTGKSSGYGSNRWIYLDRFIPIEVYK